MGKDARVDLTKNVYIPCDCIGKKYIMEKLHVDIHMHVLAVHLTRV